MILSLRWRMAIQMMAAQVTPMPECLFRARGAQPSRIARATPQATPTIMYRTYTCATARYAVSARWAV